MKSINIKEYQGRVFEAKDNFLIETVNGENSVRLNNPSNFVDEKLAEFTGKNIKVEITINIVEIPS